MIHSRHSCEYFASHCKHLCMLLVRELVKWSFRLKIFNFRELAKILRLATSLTDDSFWLASWLLMASHQLASFWCSKLSSQAMLRNEMCAYDLHGRPQQYPRQAESVHLLQEHSSKDSGHVPMQLPPKCCKQPAMVLRWVLDPRP